MKLQKFSLIPFSHLYKISFFILLPVTVFAPQGITVLTLILGSIFFLDMWSNFSLKYIFQKNDNLLFMLGIVLTFFFCSSFWSISKGESFKEGLRITVLFLAGYSVFRGLQTTSYQKEIVKSLWTGWVIAIVLLFIESKTNGLILSFIKQNLVEMFKYNKSTSIMVLFLMPVFLLTMHYSILFERKKFIFSKTSFWLCISGGFILLISAIFCLVSGASKLALINGIMLSFALYVLPHKLRKSFLQIIVCTCFIGPFIIPNIYAIPSIKQYAFKHIESFSFYDRISIWTNVRQISLNKSQDIKGSITRTLFGFGIGSSKAEIFSKQRCAWEMPKPLSANPSTPPKTNKLSKPSSISNYLSFFKREKNTQSSNSQFKAENHGLTHFGQCNRSSVKAPIYRYPLAVTEGIPLHPHNSVLQTTLELGLLGTFFFFLMIQLCIQGIWKLNSNPPYVCMLSGTLVSFLIIASISYGIWQSWWICTIWLVLSVSQLLRAYDNPDSHK